MAIADLNEENAVAVAAEIAAAGGSAEAFGVDVAEPASVSSMTQRTVERFGRIDVLVNTRPSSRRSAWDRSSSCRARSGSACCGSSEDPCQRLGFS